MPTYSTYSETGRVRKTTTVINLAIAHAWAGLRPLVAPLDLQDDDLSHLFGVDDQWTDSVDSIVRHTIRHPSGDFDDLIRTIKGVDITPEHSMLSDLADSLQQGRGQAGAMGEAFGMRVQLLHVLREADVLKEYDILVRDPPAIGGPHLYSAIHATRSLVILVEPGAKGRAAAEGFEALITGFEGQLKADAGVLTVVLTGLENTRDRRQVLAEIDYLTLEIISKRASLMEGCWMEQCSAFRYVREHRSRRHDYEIETLAQFNHIVRHLEGQVGIDAPNPPELNDADHKVMTM